MLTVHFFARARDLVGKPSLEISWIDGESVSALKRNLAVLYPRLLPLIPKLLVAVNNNFAGDATPIRCDDEVACFPPVSGG